MEFNQINLTTQDHVDRRIVYGVLGGVVTLLALFTLSNAVSGIQAYRERSAYQAKITDLQQQAQTLTDSDKNAGNFNAETAKAMQNRSRQANFLIALDLFPWIRILDELESAIPSQVVLDRFLPEPDLTTIRITGRTSSVEPITHFQEALEKSEIFQSVVLENMDFGTGSSALPSPNGNGAMKFEIICGLNLKALFPEAQYGEIWMTLASQPTGNKR